MAVHKCYYGKDNTPFFQGDHECCFDGCNQPPKYIIEWYSLNQHGENPHIADERSVCKAFWHIVRSAFHEDYGHFPDGIVDYETLDIEHPDLLERVIAIMRTDPELEK